MATDHLRALADGHGERLHTVPTILFECAHHQRVRRWRTRSRITSSARSRFATGRQTTSGDVLASEVMAEQGSDSTHCSAALPSAISCMRRTSSWIWASTWTRRRQVAADRGYSRSARRAAPGRSRSGTASRAGSLASSPGSRPRPDGAHGRPVSTSARAAAPTVSAKPTIRALASGAPSGPSSTIGTRVAPASPMP